MKPEEVINQYRITDRIGEGGMGTVFLAEDTRLQRNVALKFVSNSIRDSTDIIARFRREARAAARLNHPNICTVYELGEAGDNTFIAMEYVEGITLKERIQQSDIKEQDIRTWLQQIADGLLTAHEEGIIHRDIKPANIMITPKGLIKIMDFGIAKMIESETEITQEKSTIGTIAYMSPEQARGDSIDQRSDIWSLGIILYELVTGRRPFQGAFREAVLYAMMHEEVVLPSTHNPDTPEDLEHIIMKCLQRDQVARYGSLDELFGDLQGHKNQDGKIPDTSSTDHELKTSIRPLKKEVKAKQIGALTIRPGQKRWTIGGMLAFMVVLLLIPNLRAWFLGSASQGSLPTAMHMVVLPFDTFGGEEEDQSLSNGLAHLVASNLLRMDREERDMWIIPVREVLSREVTSASEAREKFDVNLAVSGTIVYLGDIIQITLDVTDTESLKVIESSTIELAELTPLAVQEQVMSELGNMLGLQHIEQVENPLLAAQTSDPEAYKLYIQALGYNQRLEDMKFIDEAIRLFEQAIARDSLFALAYAGAGLAYNYRYFTSNEPRFIELAKDRSEKALALNDQLAEVWVPIGYYRIQRGEREAAVEALKQAIEIDPENFEAHRLLGRVYMQLGQSEKAEKHYLRAIELQPNYWLGYNVIGVFYSTIGEPEKAVPFLEKNIELTPDNPWGYLNLAFIYRAMGDQDKAAELWLESIEIRPMEAAYMGLGWYYNHKREFDLSLYHFLKALELEPNSILRTVNVAYTYEVVGQMDSAKVYWEQALEIGEEVLTSFNQEDKTSLLYMAEAYASLGDTIKTHSFLERYKSVLADPNDTYLLAMLYEHLNERTNALHYVEEAIKEDALLEASQLTTYDATTYYRPGLMDLLASPEYQAILDKYDR